MQIAHGNGQMRAQSFSIQVSDRTRCTAGCRFCIARMTPKAPKQAEVKTCDLDRLKVGLNYARSLGATHSILTSKADPLQEELGYLKELARASREFLPLIDIHTNGIEVVKEPEILWRLKDSGLTMVTYSIASFDDVKNEAVMGMRSHPEILIPTALKLGLLIRCSLVVNGSSVSNVHDVLRYIRTAGSLGVHMVVVREVWTPPPALSANLPTAHWSLNNKIDIGPIQEAFLASKIQEQERIRVLDPLPWGTPVFAVSAPDSVHGKDHAVNVTFARCEEGTRGTVIKSIVHRPDGHGYRNWDSLGDILY